MPAAAVLKLQAEWYDYIDKLGLATESGLAKAGFTAASTNRPIRARRFFKEAIEKGSKNALVFEKYGELLDDEGQNAEAKEMFDKAPDKFANAAQDR